MAFRLRKRGSLRGLIDSTVRAMHRYIFEAGDAYRIVGPLLYAHSSSVSYTSTADFDLLDGLYSKSHRWRICRSSEHGSIRAFYLN
jgi:hypothetical protein